MNQEMHSELFSIKKHARDVLYPLYEKHARDYLARVVKTAGVECRRALLDDFDTLIKYATCHEIAINRNSDLNVETHQNSHGYEREYSTHAKSKHVSRDKRVRIIWYILRDILVNDWDNIEPLSIDQHNYVYCPICGEVFAEILKYEIDFDFHGCRCIYYDDQNGQFSNTNNYLLCNIETDDIIEDMVVELDIGGVYSFRFLNDDGYKALDERIDEYLKWERKEMDKYRNGW